MLLTLLVTDAVADAADGGVLVPIEAFVRASNAGDRAAVIAAFTTDSTIVDEYAPFLFSAPHAAAKWYDGSGPDQTSHGVTDAHSSIAAPKLVTVAGTRAYVVVPSVYAFKVHGKPAKETGLMACTLVRRGTQWKISSMAWAKLTDTSIP